MKITKALLMTMGLAVVFTACGQKDDENPTGSWTSATPTTVTEKVADAKLAVKTVSMDFNAPVDKAPGEVVLTAVYDVTAPYVTDSATVDRSYQVTASIKGTWTPEEKGDDDYLLTFDTNSLSVSGVDAPELGPVTDEFLSSLAPLAKIEDVKVSEDGSRLVFETGHHPEVKYHFVRATK